MIKLSQRAMSLQPSATLALAAKAKELESQGKDVISLSVGEPDWDTYDRIKLRAVSALNEGMTKYTPSNGIPQLRKAIAKQVRNDIGVHFDESQVSVTAGAKFSIFSALQVVCGPGDEVIIPSPYWVSYPTMVELAGASPVITPCDRTSFYKLDAARLKKCITPQTKLLILNSPSNPTGYFYQKEELKMLADVLLENPHVAVLSDDIYNRLVFDVNLAPHLLEVCPELSSRVIMVNGLSKSYSMTGWRVGWALGPKEVIGAMNKYQSQSVSCASAFAQEAAIVAIEDCDVEIKQSLTLLKERRNMIVALLGALPGIELSPPDGAFYLWPNISFHFGRKYKGNRISGSSDFAHWLLEDQMVVAVPGVEFGLEGYLRISYALDEETLRKASQRIAQFIDRLD